MLADADNDGALSEAEHFDFQHPEESSNPALHAHLLAEDVRDRAGDHHKDRCHTGAAGSRVPPNPWSPTAVCNAALLKRTTAVLHTAAQMLSKRARLRSSVTEL